VASEGIGGEDSDGKKFLHAILRSENIDLYAIPAVNMIIEFLYQKYRKSVFKWNIRVYAL
jgi:hypothetical protein